MGAFGRDTDSNFKSLEIQNLRTCLVLQASQPVRRPQQQQQQQQKQKKQKKTALQHLQTSLQAT